MNIRVWSLLLVGLASGSGIQNTLLTFYKTYDLEANTKNVQTTHSGSMTECASVCHRKRSAGLYYDNTDRVCTIIPEAVKVVRGSGVYLRDGWLVELLVSTGYIRVGNRFVWPRVEDTKGNEIADFCAEIFAFGTIFVPKSAEEMNLLGQSLNKEQQDKEMWIGLNDFDQEGTPVWDDGTPYNGLQSLDPMRWKDDEEMKDNQEDKDRVSTKWKNGDQYWETKFKKDTDSVKGVLCQVVLYEI